MRWIKICSYNYGEKSHTPTDRLVVSRQILRYHGYGIHSHYGFTKKKLIPTSLTEIIQSIYLTFLSGVPRFSDGMFRPECGGLRHVVRAMLTASVWNQTLKMENFCINPLCFHGKSCLKFRYSPFPVYCCWHWLSACSLRAFFPPNYNVCCRDLTKNKTEKSFNRIVVQKELQYYKMASMASTALLKIGDNKTNPGKSV